MPGDRQKPRGAVHARGRTQAVASVPKTQQPRGRFRSQHRNRQLWLAHARTRRWRGLWPQDLETTLARVAGERGTKQAAITSPGALARDLKRSLSPPSPNEEFCEATLRSKFCDQETWSHFGGPGTCLPLPSQLLDNPASVFKSYPALNLSYPCNVQM